MYRNVDDLVERAMVINTLTEEEKKELQDLIKLYWYSYYNPPEGVIGVGKVTYAERILMIAQREI